MTAKSSVYGVLLLILMVVLAGCGGTDDDNRLPEATPEPTLTNEERAALPPGTVENPLQMVIAPVLAVRTTLSQVITDIAPQAPESVEGELSLRDDLGFSDTLDELETPLSEAFDIRLTDTESIVTFDDLVRFVHHTLSVQASEVLSERSGIAFEVVPVDGYADSLAALCDSNVGIVAMSWLNSLSYAAAVAQNCGQPALQIEMLSDGYNVGTVAAAVEVMPEATPEVTPEITPETDEDEDAPTATPEPTETPVPTATPQAELESTPEVTPEALVETGNRTGTTTQIFVNRALGTTSYDVLRGRVFCHTGITDIYSWLVPSIMMQTNGVDPVNDVEALVEVVNPATLLQEIAEGRCTAGAMSADMFDAVASVLDEDTLDAIAVMGRSAPLPYGILVYPPEIDLGVRITMEEVLTALATDDDGEALRWLLGFDLIALFDPDSLAAFDAFIAVSGYDFSQLGN